MRFETTFSVPGEPALVIERFSDVPAMAGCVPGASVEPPDAQGRYPATLIVAFGPKRIAFKGSLTNRVDRSACRGVLNGHASADMRAAKMAVEMTYILNSEQTPEGPATRVLLVSEAELTGVLADFANTGGVAVTNAVLQEFVRRFTAQYGAADRAGGSHAAAEAAPAEALPAMRLVPALLRGFFAALPRLFGRWPRKNQ